MILLIVKISFSTFSITFAYCSPFKTRNFLCMVIEDNHPFSSFQLYQQMSCPNNSKCPLNDSKNYLRKKKRIQASNFKLQNLILLSCKIKRYQLTQQIYFKCNDQVDDQVTSRIDLDHQMINSYSRFSKKLEFIFFENDHLLPSVIANQTHENLSNYDLINLVDYNSLLDSNELSESTGKLISQIVGFISTPNFNQPNNFNLSLEIKMPDLYFRVLGLIDSKLELKRAEINKQNLSLNHKKTEKDKNLFDQIFVQNSLLTETNSLYFDISSSTPKTSNNVLLMNKNLKLKNYDSSIQQIYEKHFLTNSKRLKNFKNLLIKNWFRVHNYQVLYGMFKNDTNGPHIEWSEKNFNAICDIRRLLSSTNSTKYALYSHLKCNLTAKNPNIHFIGLRHSPHHTELTKSQPPNPQLASIIHLIDEYAQLFRINIKDDLTTNLSIMAQIRAILHHNYQFFDQKVLYFFSLVSILILSANIVIYLILKKSLLMPRSFQHCIINKWLSVLSLILFFIVGIKQIFIPHLCLITAIGSHFLMLASFLWYLLYYWCLYSKLRVLEKRNFNLIFNNNNIQLKKLSEHEEEEEYVKKPVVHLYMLGYGIPILLVSIIISITKRDYVQVPYSVCFTNEPNILIGSIILPVCFVFLVQLVLVGLIWATLRRIVKDLNMEDLESKPEDPKINEEKKELCKNWLINRDLNVNDCIEVKTNPSTQKSVVNFNRDVYPESNTSFNSDSDRTSIMDTQHKPHIQLKFSLFSSVIFLSICLLAGCASTLDHDLAFTYLLSLALFVYSVLEISFYVLSRDDLFSLDLNFSFSFSNDKNKSDESTESHSNETNSQDNNWYFEPNEEKTECPKIEDLYERFNFNDLNSTKKNVTNTILEEESMEEDDHKRSISDALFSAKKSHSMVTRNVDEIVDESKTTDLRPSLAMSEDLSDSTVCSQKFYESRSKKVKKSSYSYEEKNRNDQVIIEEYVSKLDDLLSSNCLVNTGAAAETVATIAKVKRRSNSSMTSSVVTTSNESNFNANHVTNPNLVVNSYLGDDDIYNSNSIYHVGSTSQRSSSVCSNVWQKNSIERTSGKFATRNKPYATPRKAANLNAFKFFTNRQKNALVICGFRLKIWQCYKHDSTNITIQSALDFMTPDFVTF
ncbi:adhesion G -coupled receptor A3 [Brachionus plicatilis]|uniref:Adhesion G-coupled receptor A3 n=1 Tax=Brachionus plicatilis TaxID=10195 RepID=A0A3M7T3R1_BRAPC|nr:adhesion G -coupled receptor A3 [Brachionus plicatilis]